MYVLKRKQFVPINLETAWSFFSAPENLQKITPAKMGFVILSDIPESGMYAGQIIRYTVKPLMGIPLEWVTEIKHVADKSHFVDEQRKGPYKFWYHQHFFKAVDGGTEISDIVHYALPLGILGRMAHAIFVKKQLEDIFKYREEVIKKTFGV